MPAANPNPLVSVAAKLLWRSRLMCDVTPIDPEFHCPFTWKRRWPGQRSRYRAAIEALFTPSLPYDLPKQVSKTLKRNQTGGPCAPPSSYLFDLLPQYVSAPSPLVDASDPLPHIPQVQSQWHVRTNHSRGPAHSIYLDKATSTLPSACPPSY